MSIEQILKARPGESYSISAQGLQQMLLRPRDSQYPQRHVVWTDDFKVELPIRKTSDPVGSIQPETLIDVFRRAIKQYPQKSALSVKRQGKWQTLTYRQYYEECIKFAASMIAFSFPQYTSVNIIGFNSPEWAISYYGSLFARSIATGIYTTNNQQTCQFIAQNSNCKLLIAQNVGYLNKYPDLLRKGQFQLIVIYNDPKADLSKFGNNVIQWADFLKQGSRLQIKAVQQRMNQAKPGNCCTLVYTSGTTGMPKGVMLSHDNLTWTKKSMDAYYERQEQDMILVSYLPLSHVAGLYSDLVASLMSHYHIFFAQPDALQGSLIQTLKEVRPHAFFSVPRVWEKIHQKMMQIAKSNGFILRKIATWAKSIGPEGVVNQMKKQPTSFQYKVAKFLVYNNVRKQLGLDRCTYTLYGAAPLDPTIRLYFMSLGFFLINSYGMSESTGPQNFSNKDAFDYKSMASLREVGSAIPGTQLKIAKNDPRDQDGEICYRGRNVFMGYYRNPAETSKTFDEDMYLHSGDNGKLTSQNVLFITGRAKQLIITAGGQNIPPVLIQNQIKAALPFISNVMVVGEGKKYLGCLITLKEDAPGSGKLEINCKDGLKAVGIEANTIVEAISNPKLKKVVEDGLKTANSKAISRAQNVQNFVLLAEDFTVENGALTPTLKLKRKEVSKKYNKEIQGMYIEAKL